MMELIQDSHGTVVVDSPIRDAEVTSLWGPRPPITATYTTRDFHFGVDLVPLAVPALGHPIEALRRGTSVAFDNDPRDAAGLVVRLKHNGYDTEYFHTREGGWRPPAGRVIEKGLTFAEVGGSGGWGPHLHLVLRKQGKTFNYVGWTGDRYATNHIDPLSEEGLAFFNGGAVQEWTLSELRKFAVTAVARGEYEITQRAGSPLLVVETKLS